MLYGYCSIGKKKATTYHNQCNENVEKGICSKDLKGIIKVSQLKGLRRLEGLKRSESEEANHNRGLL